MSTSTSTTSTSPDVDVLITGAGPCGLVLAIGLARNGVSFRLIDKADEAFQGSRGKGLQPRTLEIFSDLGALEGLLQAGVAPYPDTRVYHDDGVGYDDRPFMEKGNANPSEPFQGPLMSPQFITEGVLRATLAQAGSGGGHRPDYGHELVSFEQDPSGVTAKVLVTATGEQQVVRARYLVGADGGRSVVRHQLGIDFPGISLDVRGLVADLVIQGEPITRDVWHTWKTLVGPVSLCPLACTSLWQLQTVAAPGEDISLPVLNELMRERLGRQDIVATEVRWASIYNMSARLASKYREGRVFIAGDAAHVHPPTGGQGLNTSVQDAYNLGWKLAAVIRGSAPETLLDTYEGERRPIAAAMIELAVGYLKEAKEGGNRKRGREAQQLDLGYPESPLSARLGYREGKLGAGNRAPEAPCRHKGGEATTLFKLFRGPHWTLLGFDVEGSQVEVPKGSQNLHIYRVLPEGGNSDAVADLVDDGGHIRTGYALAAGDWVLIRPDGYIATVVSSQEFETLISYLRTWTVC